MLPGRAKILHEVRPPLPLRHDYHNLRLSVPSHLCPSRRTRAKLAPMTDASEGMVPKLSSEDPVQNLVAEHHLLLGVLDAFERYAAQLRIGTAEPNDLVRFTIFFRDFGNLVHHEKEESLAFAALSLHGFKPGAGPRAHMHDQHLQERKLMSNLVRQSVKAAPWSDEDRQRIVSLVAGYCANQRQHMRGEDEHFYPAIRSTLSGEEGQSLARKLSRFDEEFDSDGQLSWLMQLGEELMAQFAA